ncbi:polysialyltransferase family glycosyltransferase [Microtetraspora sp. NBRC 16547]|uniref:polysialyltransferase family glycosyltransferase n=1 Tax=Microtetraspora sp. NBRC 16547 TaxID=3030993 RepID=UPI0024A2978F|nr:polysialyltransferase family glycosyltransferase [Microtetraspora sp. NBRC 16547]GLX01147.1 hypothetical protein Misp02_52330 [Microtetraspora sp. NBRC 16547]
MGRTTLFCASTLFGAMTLAAACDEGLFGTGRRVLLVSNNAAIPEITPALDDAPGFAGIRDRFDEVVSWNAIIAPLHPSDWKARSVETPMLGRLLSARLGEPDELVVESITVPPSRTLAGLLKDIPITVYSDGLMSYGPTRFPLPREIAGRITRLLHLDLVPGLAPLLLSECGVPPVIVSRSALTRVIEQIKGDTPTTRAADSGRESPHAAGSGHKAEHADDLDQDAAPPAGSGQETRCADGRGREAVILGQCLSSLDILTTAEEAGLHEAMLRGLAARGHRKVVFKPHPAAGRRHARELRPIAEELGVELLIAPGTMPAEVCFAVHRPQLVVGCFSTALVTARRFFGIPAATVGGDLVLERLSPYENGSRIPATVIDASLPRLSVDGSLVEPPPVDLNALVRAVGYCMRSAAHPDLREAAAAFIKDNIKDGGAARYFKHRRLSSLALLPTPMPDPASGREPKEESPPGQGRDPEPSVQPIQGAEPTQGTPGPGSAKTPVSRLRRFLSR